MATAGTRVLVVEDDEGMREAMETLFDAAGMPATAYASAEALLGSGAIGNALCLITDVKLPAMSGLELLAHLRTCDPHPPVIVITAHDSPGMRYQVMRLGAAAYLPKPFEGNALLTAVRGVTTSQASKP
jgi:FixJ family two-component response regulator